MVLRALQGALAFLTRLPVGGDERAWNAFRRTPVAFVLAGYVVGGFAALPLSLPLPLSTVAALYLATLYLLTGVTHVDGLADVADAAAVHDDSTDRERRRAVMKDAETGVGGTLAVVLVLVTLALGALGTAGSGPRAAVAIALAAEVGAKTGMATLVCLGDAAHEGLGSALTESADATALLPVVVACVPVLALAPPLGVPAVVAALLGGPAVSLLVLRWSRAALGGISGDVLGATNELGRAAGVHAGVVAWALL
ncbi:adenosylcobinamide-GDP ribazoletransferase [Salinigranum sp. GCM10025319]|uniref:adenosylcobinamide-GDP ribazoletransferase n=1 Tax=Salinigranum sp. GCM10025319 TaxID=3252687 RepID=UPI003611AC1E